ncbi:hypothetical protein GLOTRDRAFT_135689 [Gloeophyllum trabeum ATCC 11539]|uniref:Uncharacterized protein n=1 Tax=Gloeophyllum trabeum (strain ATCC 11539 / FP-39264 / Madison 617) TaxID=670483 RepID=S7S162_GLOTA|nr:uncharacterized protein GLOTRDRAFT_135689 [Gloeophyllum trabeum ATCC 11539]EPQ61150.1 hypothetical protein GLOTRDRAFT_135689 [Gloeophyllum trabeum ATCC 11539]
MKLLKNKRGLLLAVLSHLSASLTLVSGSEAPSIKWTSPASGDTYGPGDTITGEWSVEDGALAVNSPSFKLCTKDGASGGGSGSSDQQGSSDDGGKNESGDEGSGDGSGQDASEDGKGSGEESGNTRDQRRRSDDSNDGSCGETVWPTVQQSSGSYSVSLAVPNVTSLSGYYLLMMDDFGNKMSSPSFSLSPTSPSSSSSAPSSTISSLPVSSSKSSHTEALDSPSATSDVVSNSYPDLAAAHAPPPVAAFAIPLSIVGAIIVAAVVLGILHWRKLKQERLRDAENLKSISDRDYMSRRSSLLSSTSRKSDEKMDRWGPGYMGSFAREEQYPSTTYAEPVQPMRGPSPAHWDPCPPQYTWSARREPERRYITRQAFPEDHYTAPSYSHSLRGSFPPSRSVPASTFRSPRVGPGPSVLHHMPRPPDPPQQDCHRNAAVNHSVISNYLQPSPIPCSLWPSSPPSGSPSAYDRGAMHFVPDPVPEPEKLFVRRSAPGVEVEHPMAHGDVYDRVTRSLYPR